MDEMGIGVGVAGDGRRGLRGENETRLMSGSSSDVLRWPAAGLWRTGEYPK